ncbi:cytosolic tryparedoxin peroxidase, trypanosomatid typical 2-Cys peroxiredoxin [Anaerolineae bacterium]|nr:cytosolic tryparedoxin peroxidase, trypanosomatid typical 2-Cys peroxiredoxin [Anaerolineae bacterium]
MEPLTHKKLSVGDQAPDFTLLDQSNRSVQLSGLLEEGVVVLFFYPKDYSMGCTAEVCAFRDNFEAFRDAGAIVVGVSADTTESHQGFAERHRLPFILLSDPEDAVHKLYGVEKTLGIFRGRVTYVIDQQGSIRHVFSSQINIDKHVKDALQIIRAISNGR